jgi:hypothetical protein
MPLWLLPVEPVGPMLEPPRLRLDEPDEPPVEPDGPPVAPDEPAEPPVEPPVEPPIELLVPLAVEPLPLIAPIEPALCDDDEDDDGDDDEPALLVPPTAPVLDAVAPPVLEPVEVVWSLPWFSEVLLFRLPELLELPWLPAPLPVLLPALLPALLPFPSLGF